MKGCLKFAINRRFLRDSVPEWEPQELLNELGAELADLFPKAQVELRLDDLAEGVKMRFDCEGCDPEHDDSVRRSAEKRLNGLIDSRRDTVVSAVG